MFGSMWTIWYGRTTLLKVGQGLLKLSLLVLRDILLDHLPSVHCAA